MSFLSVLSNIGKGIEKFFAAEAPVIDAIDKVAVKAEPFVDVAFPAVAPLFNGIVGEVGKAEALAVAAGKQSGTGAQKLSLVITGAQGFVADYEKAAGVKLEPAQVTSAINAVVAFLNSLPASTS